MKKKTMLLLSLVFAFIASASMLAFAATTHANAATVDGSATNLQILDARMETDDGTDKKLGLVINQNLGGDAFAAGTFTADKVVYTAAAGGTRTLSKVYYKLFDSVTAGIVLSFSEDTATDGAVTYGEGDTVTIQADFTVAKDAGATPAYKVAEDFTLTYTDGKWTGTYPDANLSNVTVSFGQLYLSGQAVIIDFGVDSPTGSQVLIDKTGDWANALPWMRDTAFPHIEKYVFYNRNGRLDYIRMAGEPGKFGIDIGSNPQNGDYIHLKKGFVFYSMSVSAAYYPGSGSCYRPILVLHKDICFTYDGTNWNAAVPATSAEFTNTDEEKGKLFVGGTLQLKYSVNDGATEPIPTFTSSDESVLTVSETGVVSGVAEGTATVTAHFMETTATVELTVAKTPEINGLTASVQTGAIRDGKKGIVAYVGDTAPTKQAVLDAVKQAAFTYDNGATGVAFDLDADATTLITTGFDSSAAGETSVKIEVGGFSCDIPVYVYETKTMTGTPGPGCVGTLFNGWSLFNFSSVIPEDAVGDPLTQIDISAGHPENAIYGVENDMISVIEPAHYGITTEHKIWLVGQYGNVQMIAAIGGVDGLHYEALPVGTRIVLNENLKFYRNIDNWWIASYKIPEAVTFVWTGSAWADYTAEAESVVLESEEIEVPLNGSTILNYSLSPAGSYVTPTIAIAEGGEFVELEGNTLKGKAEGTAKVTFTIGENVTTLTVKVEEITVSALETRVTFGATREEQKYLVAYKGEAITPEYVAANVKANFLYSNDTRGGEFDITAEQVTIAEGATANAGASTGITLTVTPEGGDPISCKVPLWVYETKTLGNPTEFRNYGDALTVWFATQIEGAEASAVNTLDFRTDTRYGVTADMATFREPTHGASSTEYTLYTVGQASEKQCLLYFSAVSFNNPASIRVGSVLTLTDSFRFYRYVDNFWVAMYKLADEVSYVWTGSAWANFVGEATEIKVEENEITVPLNRSVELSYTVLPAGAYVTPTIAVADETVATVANGSVQGLKVGETTLTFTVNGKDTVVTIKVEDLSVKALESQVTIGATREGKKYLVAYKGEAITAEYVAARATFNYVFANDSKSTPEAVTAAMVTIPENATANVGESKVTITYTETGKDPVSCDIPVWVYDVSVIESITADNIVYWGNAMDIAFGNLIAGVEESGNHMVQSVNILENPQYGITSDMATIRGPKHGVTELEYTLHSIGQVTNKQAILYFSNVNGADPGQTLRIGSVLTFNTNYRFYRWVDNTWIAMYKFGEKLEFVWTERGWDTFVADATGVEVEEKLDLLHNAKLELQYTLTPEGSFVTPTIESSNSEIVEVLPDGSLFGKAIGKATVTITVCEDVKTVEVTVIESHPQGFVLGNGRSLFYVAQGDEFDLGKISAQVDYGDGFYGEAFTLNKDNATMELDTSVAGRRDVTINITRSENGQDVTGSVQVAVEVVESVAQIPDSLWSCVDNGNFLAPAIAVHFTKTFPNPGNVTPGVLSPEQAKTITDNITYVRTRDENGELLATPQNIDVAVSGYLTFLLCFTPKIGEEPITQYREGDVITLKKGLTFYRWFGDVDGNNVPVGEGDYVKCGQVEYDITFTFRDGNFFMEIQYVDGKALAEKVTVGLGGQAVSNVATVPEYATVGEWTFSSSDETIASVNARGLISGNKIGTVTVTATLSGGAAGDKVITFTVEVTDSVKGIKINVPDGLRVDLGTELTGAKLAELGVTAQKVWSSDKVEGDVDLTNARITGYDPAVEGEQQITIRVSVDGKSVSEKITITVGAAAQEDAGCGCSCGSSITPTMIFGGGCLIILALLLLRRRKAA